MTAADRRMEIISILVVSGHVTSRELAQEFGVTRRTILHGVAALSYGYPIYTKPGEGGGRGQRNPEACTSEIRSGQAGTLTRRFHSGGTISYRQS